MTLINKTFCNKSLQHDSQIITQECYSCMLCQMICQHHRWLSNTVTVEPNRRLSGKHMLSQNALTFSPNMFFGYSVTFPIHTGSLYPAAYMNITYLIMTWDWKSQCNVCTPCVWPRGCGSSFGSTFIEMDLMSFLLFLLHTFCSRPS